MSKGTSSDLNSEQDLASIPTAQGGLSRLAIAHLKSAGVPVVPLLRRVGLTPEVIADPEERLSVRSQIALLVEAAKALKDDRLGFTLARDFDLREIGLLYYVMASSQRSGRVMEFNPAAEQTFGRRRAEVLGQPINTLIVPPHLRQRHRAVRSGPLNRAREKSTGCNLIPSKIRSQSRRDAEAWATHSPVAVIHSPAAMVAEWPTTVTNSRCPRALVRRTQKPRPPIESQG
jgi:PAS domain-containing protein